MTTSTRQASRSGGAPREALEPVGELLSLAPAEVERRGSELLPRLERATLAELTPSAARLIDLLDDDGFGTSHPEVREAVVRAVLRLGYPWALQLPPEDLALLHREETGKRATWLRRALVAALAVAALAAGGLSWALLGQEHQTAHKAPSGPRTYTLPTLEQVLPPSQRADTTTQLMRELCVEGKHDEALRLGLDCLADPDLAPSTCLNGLIHVYHDRHAATRNPVYEEFARELSGAQWTLRDVTRPSPAMLSVLRDVERHLPADTRTSPPTLEERAEGSARGALAVEYIEQGDAPAAIHEAEACLRVVPDSVRCHLVRFTGHTILQANTRDNRGGHGEVAEAERRELTRLMLKQKRLECGTTARPHPPLGCLLKLNAE